MPAAPIMGLIFFPSGRKILKSFAIRTPPIVSKINANKPSPKISSVPTLQISAAFMVNATVIPRSNVTKFAKIFCAVSDKLSKTPHSLIKLPNIKKPIRAAAPGAIKPVIIVTKMGNKILVSLETALGL